MPAAGCHHSPMPRRYYHHCHRGAWCADGGQTWCVFSDVECIESGHELSHNRAQYSPCLFQPLSMIARPPQNILQLQQTQPDLASLLIL